jgi:hypothetical protein
VGYTPALVRNGKINCCQPGSLTFDKLIENGRFSEPLLQHYYASNGLFWSSFPGINPVFLSSIVYLSIIMPFMVFFCLSQLSYAFNGLLLQVLTPCFGLLLSISAYFYLQWSSFTGIGPMFWFSFIHLSLLRASMVFFILMVSFLSALSSVFFYRY